MDTTQILFQGCCVILLIFLSAFFSSAETSLTTVSRIRIMARAESGEKKARILLSILDNSHQMLSAILVGNNLVNMAASALTTTLTIRLVGSSFVGLMTGLLTLIVLLFGEITPKTLATIEAEKIALSYAWPVHILMILLSPAVWVVDKLSRGVMFLLKIDPDAKSSPVTEREIRTMVNAGEEDGAIENEEKEMINNVFDFGDSVARDVMIPRIDMIFLNLNESLDQLLTIFRKCKHTRYPVFENDTDNVVGIVNIKDLLLLSETGLSEDGKEEIESFHISRIMREPFFTYEYKSTAELLVEMRLASVSVAVVLDEYGATAGLVTLEDLLEQIVGDIRDEYDADEEENIHTVREGREYIARGGAKLDELNETLGLALVSQDNDSIGGYIMEKLDRIPKVGDSVNLDTGIRLCVDDVSKNRIEQVHIWMPESS